MCFNTLRNGLFLHKMNKKKIRWIIALMAPALLGIIVLQVYWIENDLKIKEKQLDQNVRLAMNAIVDRIETNEAFTSFNANFFNFDSISYDFFGNPDTMHTQFLTAEDIAANDPVAPPTMYDDQDGGLDFRIVGPGSSQMIIKMKRSKSTGGNSFDEKTWRNHYRIASRRDSIQNNVCVQNNNMKCRL